MMTTQKEEESVTTKLNTDVHVLKNEVKNSKEKIQEQKEETQELRELLRELTKNVNKLTIDIASLTSIMKSHSESIDPIKTQVSDHEERMRAIENFQTLSKFTLEKGSKLWLSGITGGVGILISLVVYIFTKLPT